MTQPQRFVLITGATSDIGSAIAEVLKLSGYEPVLVGRDSEKLHGIAAKLAIDTKHCFVFDNTDCNELTALFKTVVKEVGKLSGMVLCAGLHEIRPLKAQTEKSVFNAFQQNTLSAMMFIKNFSSSLYSIEKSSVVLISSTAALLGESGLSAYSAAKGALISATKSLAVELSPRGVRVNCISPGWVETQHAEEVKSTIGEIAVEQIRKLYPLGFGAPTDVANAAQFLLSDKSSWITGQNLVVDGGRTLL
jgi:NAD(P)-dependent dehydrogenase (short-subunit alcohol dehydrogenase family)